MGDRSYRTAQTALLLLVPMGKKGKGWRYPRHDPGRRVEELRAQAAWRQAEADDEMIGGWAGQGAAGGGAGLVRQRSRRGAAYDELLDKGIPHHMLRRAWVVADGDPEGAMSFVRANFDQPGAFWHSNDDQAPEFRGAPPPAAATSSDQDEGASLRRALSTGSQPRRSGAQLPWQHTQPVPEPETDEQSSVPHAMLVEQPLHDLLAESHTALAAATNAWEDAPHELAEPQMNGGDIVGEETSQALTSPELMQAERDLSSLRRADFAK